MFLQMKKIKEGPHWNTKSTVGIECNQFKFSNGDISLWDFAGQMEYTVTHQFFLSNEVHLISLSFLSFLEFQLIFFFYLL